MSAESTGTAAAAAAWSSGTTGSSFKAVLIVTSAACFGGISMGFAAQATDDAILPLMSKTTICTIDDDIASRERDVAVYGFWGNEDKPNTGTASTAGFSAVTTAATGTA